MKVERHDPTTNTRPYHLAAPLLAYIDQQLAGL